MIIEFSFITAFSVISNFQDITITHASISDGATIGEQESERIVTR